MEASRGRLGNRKHFKMKAHLYQFTLRDIPVTAVFIYALTFGYIYLFACLRNYILIYVYYVNKERMFH